MPKKKPIGVNILVKIFLTPAYFRKSEVEVVRVKITLACTECKQRNYNMTKDKKTHPDRMETKKYCKFCKSHTLHKETK
jgi:large subunit ribosomal protein L33